MTLSGHEVEITQTHHYPWDADLTFSIHVTEPTSFKWALRIPGWCKQAEVKVNGEAMSLDHLENGYIEIQRTWKDGDVVTLHLAMPVERIRSNPLVSMNQQQIALQRGPVVFCLEEVDNGANLAGLRLTKDSLITEEFSENLLGGIVKLTIEGYRVKNSNALYSSEPPEFVPQQITAIPYYAWCNRAKGEMRVWVYES
jgi:DUF1680 family protein